MIYRLVVYVLSLGFLSLNGAVAAPATGPVVEGYGPVMAVPEGAYNLSPGRSHKVSMDVSRTGDFPEDLNRSLESAARFLNMHARTGIGPDSIEFVVVVHGPAVKDLLTDAAYKRRYEEPNPNTGLLKGLSDAGVKIYVCSQTAAFRKFGFDEFNPAVTVALSAMSAHVRLQEEGFTLIPF